MVTACASHCCYRDAASGCSGASCKCEGIFSKSIVVTGFIQATAVDLGSGKALVGFRSEGSTPTGSGLIVELFSLQGY